jgi:hypothetical protein
MRLPFEARSTREENLFLASKVPREIALADCIILKLANKLACVKRARLSRP